MGFCLHFLRCRITDVHSTVIFQRKRTNRSAVRGPRLTKTFVLVVVEPMEKIDESNDECNYGQYQSIHRPCNPVGGVCVL